jgi:exodeoxyribonuclease V alpha subunit
MGEAFDNEVTIVKRRYADERGFAVLEADVNGDEVTLVGPISHLEEHERARVIGSWVTDARYGEQVRVTEARPLAPTDAIGVAAYLKRVKHIGAKRAEALVERYGARNVMDTIDRDPAGTFRRLGLNHQRAQEAAASWNELRATRQLHLLLAPHGLAYLATRINEQYPNTALRVIAENPYELTRVFGVGFRTAERIAVAAGAKLWELPGRPGAAVLYTLSEAEGRGGNTCLPATELLDRTNRLLHESDAGFGFVPGGVDAGRGEFDENGESDRTGGAKPGAASTETLEKLSTDGDLVLDDGWAYRTETWELEQELCERLEAMVSAGPGSQLKPVKADITDAGELALTSEQQEAVRNAFSQRLSVITGGPGTGKTATIRTIAKLAGDQSAKFVLAAPTGRAARRMSESAGLPARTVHAAIGWVPGEAPEHDEDQPLNLDLLIVDESSMANLELMVTLLRAVPVNAHVVFVGDADQLAPVGAGKPFADMVASEVVPTIRLTHIFRQAAGSMIVQGAHAVRRGDAPDFSVHEGMRRDLFMIERQNAGDALAEIVSLVAARLPKHYAVDPVSDIQVFAPVYRGDVGIDALNRALRQALNPDGAAVGGGRLRVGDKLIMTGRNLHELGLMNGTVLQLLDEVASAGGDSTTLLLRSDEQTFRLPAEEAGNLQLGYACSVHRGQGIELPIAVIVAHEQAGAFFLRREMLYTAITRATMATIIVGSRNLVARAARLTDTDSRYSRLGERLRSALGEG